MRKLSKKEKVLAYDAQRLVEKFNSLYPMGSVVELRKTTLKSFPYASYVVKSDAFIVNEIDAVAFFHGISGYFSIEPDFIKYP